jgi:hypothetical protein
MIKLKIAHMREQFGFEELRGDIEDRTAQIKSSIFLFKIRLGYHQKSEDPVQSHEHKVESEHNEEPSLSPSERLRASLSSRNAAHT